MSAAAALASDPDRAVIAGHHSAEPGTTAGFDWLGQLPIIDLGRRLSVDTNALRAFSVVAGAVRVLPEVARFDAVEVAEK